MSLFEWDARPPGLCLASGRQVNGPSDPEDRQPRGTRGFKSKLSAEDKAKIIGIIEMMPRKDRIMRMGMIARQYGVHPGTIQKLYYLRRA